MNTKKSLLLVISILCYNSYVKSEEKSLKIALMDEFEIPDPLNSNLNSTKYILDFISKPLIYLDSQKGLNSDFLTKVPSKIDVHRPNNELRQFLVILQFKENALWADGSSMTGFDVAHSFNILKSHPENEKLLESIEDVIVNPSNPKQFQIKFRNANISNLHTLTFLHFVHQHYVRESQISNVFTGANNSEEQFKKLSNGPYYIKSFKLGKILVLERNNYYFHSRNTVPKIEMELVFHPGKLENRILQSHFDVIPNINSIWFLNRIRNAIVKKKLPYLIVENPSFIYDQICFHSDSQFAKISSLRKAIQLSLNTDMIRPMEKNLVQFSKRFYPSPIGIWDTPLTQSVLTFNNSTASHILKKAGWVKNNRGFFVDHRHQFLKIKLLTLKNRPYYLNIGKKLKELWESSGIKVEISYLMNKNIHNNFMKNKSSVDALLIGSKLPPQMSLTITKKTKDHRKLNQLYLQYLSEWNLEKKSQLRKEFIRTYINESKCIILPFRQRFSIVAKSFLEDQNSYLVLNRNSSIDRIMIE